MNITCPNCNLSIKHGMNAPMIFSCPECSCHIKIQVAKGRVAPTDQSEYYEPPATTIPSNSQPLKENIADKQVTLKFYCTHCGHKIESENNDVGSCVVCPSCKEKVQLPNAKKLPADPRPKRFINTFIMIVFIFLLLVHIWTVVVVYKMSGLILALIALLSPVISEIICFFVVGGKYGYDTEYCVAIVFSFIAFVVMIGIIKFIEQEDENHPCNGSH